MPKNRYRLIAVTTGFVFLLLCPSAVAEDAPSQEQNTDVSPAPEVTVIPKLDLGLLEVKNLEPTRNQTSKVTFGMHLAFAPGTDPAIVSALQHWQHRLREQVIVAIRVAELGDYLDPELLRLRKQILYRINRVLKGVQAEDILLADFTYSTE